MYVECFQRKVGQEEVDGPKHFDDVQMPFTIALTPDVVDKVSQPIVSLFWGDLQAAAYGPLRSAKTAVPDQK